jgi:hypothetical protein
MPGREPDMSSAQAAAMRKVLGQIEAASKLMSNREKVVKDITNPGPRGVCGGPLSQGHLKRLDPKHQASVDEMVSEVYRCLLGKTMQVKGEPLVWAQAAGFLARRIQTPSDWDRMEDPHKDRKADMTTAAAKALVMVLGQMQAVLILKSNCEKVAKDITNPGPTGLNGGPLTQLNLKRVDAKHKATVDKMLAALCERMLGKGVVGPSAPEEALVWAEAAAFLSGRIQAGDEMPGRAPDMSPAAAWVMRKELAQIEASNKLMSNRERVVKDITNPGPLAVGGGELTQLSLKRLDAKHQASVDAMVQEVCIRLLGNKVSEPSTPQQAQVWKEAAMFFNNRIQGSASECPGRQADMSAEAATALRMVLAEITNQTQMSSAAATALLTALK